MADEEPVPIVVIHRSVELHCWTILVGSHEVPIRRGYYGEAVDAATIIRELRNAAIERGGGRLKVQIQL